MLQQGAKVAVVGAGVSGLSFTYFLNRLRPDIHLTVYDGSSRSGGYIHSPKVELNGEAIRMEKGPRTLRGSSDGTVLIADTLLQLGMGNEINAIEPKANCNRKYLLGSEGLIQVPNDWKSFMRFIRSSLGKGVVTRALKEPFVQAAPTNDESVDSFISRRFGPGVANIMSAVFHGIYAGDIRTLSAKTLVKTMFEDEHTHGSILKAMWGKKAPMESALLKDYESRIRPIQELKTKLQKYPMLTFSNGLQSFPQALYESLQQQPNVSLKLAQSVQHITHDANGIVIDHAVYDHVHTTVNAHILSQLTTGPLSLIASKLISVDILLTNIYIPRDILPYHGFGYLIPLSDPNPEGILGVIFDSEIERGCVPLFQDAQQHTGSYTKLTVMSGGHHGDRGLDVRAGVERHLGIDLHAEDVHMEQEWIGQCLPQFQVGYDELKNEFDQALSGMNWSHGGMSFGDGCGVPDCVANAYKGAINLA